MTEGGSEPLPLPAGLDHELTRRGDWSLLLLARQAP